MDAVYFEYNMFKQNKIDVIEIYRYVEYTYLRSRMFSRNANHIAIVLSHFFFFFFFSFVNWFIGSF